MDLFLVRHGETDANANQIIQGWLDTELNDAGLRQAEKAAQDFNGAVDVIYASDLKRAVQTAKFFKARFPNASYIEDSRLRERNFGDAAGNPRDKYDWDEFWSSPDNQVTIPNAETIDSFNKRVQEFIDQLVTEKYKKILIVAHSGTINRFRHLINNDDHQAHGNASVTHLELN